MHAISIEDCASYAGNYFSKNYTVTIPVRPLNGGGHMICLRCSGTQRGYHAGFLEPGYLSLCKNHFGFETIKKAPFSWELGRTYTLTFSGNGAELAVSVDGRVLLKTEDSAYAYGMFGCSRLGMGRTWYGNMHVQER